MYCINKSLQLKSKINRFRKKLDSLLADHEPSSEKILKVSQELDNLILEYYRLQQKPKEKHNLK